MRYSSNIPQWPCNDTFLFRQHLDNLEVERERGITVKAQTATMLFQDPRDGKDYLLNLIDTPGHVDFSNEVAKSLRACQGALLLVDSTQSVQAQTLANYGKAQDLNMSVIPIITKIDLPFAQPEEAALSMSAVFGFDPDACIMTSAKKFEGIDAVIEAIVDGVPSPKASCASSCEKFKGRIVDSWFEEHRGLVCLGKLVTSPHYTKQLLQITPTILLCVYAFTFNEIMLHLCLNRTVLSCSASCFWHFGGKSKDNGLRFRAN